MSDYVDNVDISGNTFRIQDTDTRGMIDQRPTIISADTTIAPDRNLTIVIDTDDITVTLNAAEFIGCNVTVLSIFSSGSANVLCGSDTYTVEFGKKINLIWNGTTWQIENQSDNDITATNISVAVADFVGDSTYTDYGYKAEIPMPGVNSNYSPDVRFSLADAKSGIFAPVADAGTDKVIIYANAVPAAAITIPVIICTLMSV